MIPPFEIALEENFATFVHGRKYHHQTYWSLKTIFKLLKLTVLIYRITTKCTYAR